MVLCIFALPHGICHKTMPGLDSIIHLSNLGVEYNMYLNTIVARNILTRLKLCLIKSLTRFDDCITLVL